MSFTVEVHESLSHISDAALDRVTSRASVFFDRRWFRMLDAVDLVPLVRGKMAMRYAVVSHGGEPVGICPFIVTRSQSIHWYYSLDKFYFTTWQSYLLKLDPNYADAIRRVSRLVAAYRAFARVTGARFGGWVLAVSPLSLRGDIALAEMSAEDERLARDAVIHLLQEVASDEKLPLCFFGIQEDKTHLRQALQHQGFEELFLTYDNLLLLPGRSFTEYLGQFRSEARRLFKREIQQAREAGVRFEITQELGPLSDRLAELYERTYARYSDDYCDLLPSFWTALQQYVAPHAEAVIAYRDREPIGFSLLLHKQRELWYYTGGRSYEADACDAPIYFDLAFYEPVKRALTLGAEHIWLGPGAWEVKRRRGATGYALYNFLWFPGRWSHKVLMPYLRGYSRHSRKWLTKESRPSSYLKPRQADPRSSTD
jgi:uncharacterized protein